MGSLNSVCNIGKRNAAVLPDPVCAHAITSRPAIIMGIACFCIGVGFVYLDFCTFSNKNGRKPDSSKFCIGVGIFSPDTFTSISSNLSKLIPISLPIEKISLSSVDGSGGMYRSLGFSKHTNN